MPDTSSLPDEIVQSIAISNAKSVGEQPAILANLALANLIANTNLSQQNAIASQQAMNQLALATAARAVELVTSIDPVDGQAAGAQQASTIAEEIASLKAAVDAVTSPAGSGQGN